VLVIYGASNALGYLAQPAHTGSTLFCRDSNPVGNTIIRLPAVISPAGKIEKNYDHQKRVAHTRCRA